MYKLFLIAVAVAAVYGEAEWVVNFNNNNGCNGGCAANNDKDAMLAKAKLAWMDWNGNTPAGYSGLSFVSPKPARPDPNNAGQTLPATTGSFTAASLINFIGPVGTPFAVRGSTNAINWYQNIAFDDRVFVDGSNHQNVDCEYRADGNIFCSGEYDIHYRFPKAANPQAIQIYNAVDSILIDTHGAEWMIAYEMFAVNGVAQDGSDIVTNCNCPQ
eukprot:TRINITY_DN26817_c0_g1_i1.p1 TRINITY_DN26817_c0_g1~~TRINITY_DN26817_c0_g1_i1.p1  ORF type:complete len:229 (+),score=57.67 TRINITY_DN26817_c0_g1_i1:44-688(+)